MWRKGRNLESGTAATLSNKRTLIKTPERTFDGAALLALASADEAESEAEEIGSEENE